MDFVEANVKETKQSLPCIVFSALCNSSNFVMIRVKSVVLIMLFIVSIIDQNIITFLGLRHISISRPFGN